MGFKLSKFSAVLRCIFLIDFFRVRSLGARIAFRNRIRNDTNLQSLVQYKFRKPFSSFC